MRRDGTSIKSLKQRAEILKRISEQNITDFYSVYGINTTSTPQGYHVQTIMSRGAKVDTCA